MVIAWARLMMNQLTQLSQGLQVTTPLIEKYILQQRLMVKSFFQMRNYHLLLLLVPVSLNTYSELLIFGFKAYIVFLWKRQFWSNLVNRPSLCQCTNRLGFSLKWLTSTSLQITECLSCYQGESWAMANRKLLLVAVNVICLFARPPTGG